MTPSEIALLSLIASAVAAEIPDKMPVSLQDWWDWMHNTVKQILSIKRGFPTKPEGPAH